MSPRDAFGRVQTVLLLGGGSDIGLATVRRMVENGADKVILAGRDPDDAPAPDLVADVEYRYFDAAETATHRKFFAEVFAEHPVDTVVVAFGAQTPQSDVEGDPTLGTAMAEVNYVGALSALLHAASHLRAEGAGDIVLLSSVAAAVPRRSNFVYGSTKAGIDFMARGLAASLAETDVHVMVVRPGFVRTSMTRGMPERPFAVSAGTVARAITDGLARREKIVWVPGVLRWLMALLRMLPPRLVDRLD